MKKTNPLQKQNHVTPKNANGEFSLSEYFKSGISLAELKEGEYPAKVLSFKLVDATENSPEYVRIDLQLPDRVTNDNRFSTGFRIFESQIKKQLGIEDTELSIPDLMQHVLTQEEIKVWVSYYRDPVTKRQYRNFNYIAPIQDAAEDTTEDKETEIPTTF